MLFDQFLNEYNEENGWLGPEQMSNGALRVRRARSKPIIDHRGRNGFTENRYFFLYFSNKVSLPPLTERIKEVMPFILDVDIKYNENAKRISIYLKNESYSQICGRYAWLLSSNEQRFVIVCLMKMQISISIFFIDSMERVSRDNNLFIF